MTRYATRRDSEIATIRPETVSELSSVAKSLLIEASIQTAFVPCPVDMLVSESRIVLDVSKESLEVRHLDDVDAWLVASMLAAVNDCRQRLGKERVDSFASLFRVDVKVFVLLGVVLLCEAFALIRIEDDVGLEERNVLLDFVSSFVLILLCVRRRVNNSSSFGSFLDASAEFLDLIEREPELRSELVFHRSKPQLDDIDSAVRSSAGSKRPRDVASLASLPRHLPRQVALLELSKDLVRDLIVDVDFLSRDSGRRNGSGLNSLGHNEELS